MTPLVSIVIPCWNAQAYIGDAISSALAQTYPNFEVIVIDDGSTDGSLEIIRSFEGRVHWESGPNRGGCAARNRGVEIAAGEFVQYLDADDTLFPEKLTKQVPLACQNPTAIVYCDHQCTVAGTHQVGIRAEPVEDADPFVFVLRHRTLHTSGPIYRRDWLCSIGGFRDGLPCSQEFEMNLRLAAYLSRFEGHFVHLPEVLFEVRRRPDSVSSDTAHTFSVKAQYLPPIVEELTHRGELTSHRRSELAAYAASIGRQCVRGGKVADGLNLIRFADSLDRKSADARAWGLAARIVKRLVGPLAAEQLASWKRNLFNRRLV